MKIIQITEEKLKKMKDLKDGIKTLIRYVL